MVALLNTASLFPDNIAVVKLLDRVGIQSEKRNIGSGIIEVIYEIAEPPREFFNLSADLITPPTFSDIASFDHGSDSGARPHIAQSASQYCCRPRTIHVALLGLGGITLILR
jgi:hypothetical protein